MFFIPLVTPLPPVSHTTHTHTFKSLYLLIKIQQKTHSKEKGQLKSKKF